MESDREDPQIGDGRQDTLHIRSHRQIISQNGIVTLKGQFVQTTKLHDWFGDGQCAFAVHYQSPLGD
jgi:hypothetical protein